MASPLVLIGGYHHLVTAFEVDVRTGELVEAAASDCGTNPSYLAVSPCGHLMYAVNETAKGGVTAFSFDAAKGSLTKIGEAPAEGDDPCHITVSKSGEWVIVSNYSSGTLTVLSVDASGSVRPHSSSAPGKNAHQAVFNAAGTRLYCPFLGSDAVFQYDFDEGTGTLSPLAGAPTAALAPGAGPRHLAFNSDESIAYVLNELDCTLTSFAVHPQSGALHAPQTVSTLPCERQAGYSTAHVVVSPDNRYVYASNRGHDSLVTYRVMSGADSESSPRLETVGWENGGGDVSVPRDFTLSSDGSLLIVANQGANSVTVFSRDGAGSGLTKLRTTPVRAGSKPCFVGWVSR